MRARVFSSVYVRVLEGCRSIVCPMNDTLVWGKDEEDHNNCLKTVLQRIRALGMALNRETCFFWASKIEFLGHYVESGQVYADPEKTKAIRNFVALTSKTELHSILGSVNFLAHHIPKISQHF